MIAFWLPVESTPTELDIFSGSPHNDMTAKGLQYDSLFKLVADQGGFQTRHWISEHDTKEPREQNTRKKMVQKGRICGAVFETSWVTSHQDTWPGRPLCHKWVNLLQSRPAQHGKL